MRLKAHWKPLVDAFKTELHDKSAGIDPGNELDWYDLTVGWALAKGLKSDDAHNFASYILTRPNRWPVLMYGFNNRILSGGQHEYLSHWF